jgi:hypothetical protein
VAVGDQRTHDGSAGVVVVPDGCSQGEDTLRSPGFIGVSVVCLPKLGVTGETAERDPGDPGVQFP